MHPILLIHQKLYQSEELSGIDMQNYIHPLLDYLQDSFQTQGRIAFLTDIDALTLDVSQAVPLGLILNEAITNSIKYAFENRDVKDNEAFIRITLKNLSGNELTLGIADNGIGLPEGFNSTELNSLGMSLMHSLSRQLGAHFEFKNENGLCIHSLPGKNLKN